MISSQIAIITITKDKNIFQKNTVKEKEDIKNLITLLAAKPKIKNYKSQKEITKKQKAKKSLL